MLPILLNEHLFTTRFLLFCKTIFQKKAGGRKRPAHSVLLGPGQCTLERAIAAHGCAQNSRILPAGGDLKDRFAELRQFLHQIRKITRAMPHIGVKASGRVRKNKNRSPFPRIDRKHGIVHPSCAITTQAVQKIRHFIGTAFLQIAGRHNGDPSVLPQDVGKDGSA